MPDKNGWNRFTKNSMPPQSEIVLVWLDVGHQGFPVTAYSHNGQLTYWTGLGQKYLDSSMYRSSRWKTIAPPEEECQ